MAPLARQVGTRIASLAAVLALVSIASFGLVDLLPGDPATALLPPGTDEQTAREVRRQLGLDLPAIRRYFHWLSRVLHGDLGVTYATGEPVARLLTRAFTVTVELVVLTQVLALVVGIAVGTFAARRAGGTTDRAVQSVTFGALALPQFAIALVLLLVFAVRLHWFPAVGYVPFRESPADNIRSFVLPAVTLAIPAAATYARLLRAEMALTLASDHVLLARGLGLPEWRVVLHHALRPSLSGLLSVAATITASQFGGALVVESIFALPGVGRLLIASVGKREYFVVQGGVLAIGVGFVVVNAAVDLLRTRLDPRVSLDAPAARNAARR